MGVVMVLLILTGLLLFVVGMVSPKAAGMPRGTTVKAVSALVWGGLIGLFFFPLGADDSARADRDATHRAAMAGYTIGRAAAPTSQPAIQPTPVQITPAQVAPQPAERPAPRPRGPDRLLNASGEFVPVWISSASMGEGIRLIQAGVHRTNASLLIPLVACHSENGARIVRTQPGFFSSTVLVIEGPQSGCRGVVVNEMISDAP